MYHPKISKLIVKHLNASLNPGEKRMLDEWRASSEDNEKLFVRLTDPSYLSQRLTIMNEIREGAEWEDIRQSIGYGKLRTLQHIGWQKKLAAAAVIGIILAAGIWLIFFPTKKQQLALTTVNTAVKSTHDDFPGNHKASLILSDGHSIALDQAKRGLLTDEAGIAVSKENEGIITYAAADATTSPAIYNTLVTPRSSQYQVTLPDGSLARLNAASSIRYPVHFNEEGREVEITGEVYFEVKTQYSSKDHQKIPFRVKTASQEIQVLGTHFNVKAYEVDGTTSTTLLEGSVKVTHGNKSALLKPGQQARLTGAGSIAVVKNADTTAAIDWKNGKFNFQHCSLKTIMNEVSRWYDVEVVYKSYHQSKFFNSSSLRSVSLSQFLEILKITNDVDFKIDGRRIIVMM